jgi:hypothetical protein
VIAFASGGALETVRGAFPGQTDVKNPTGVFFAEQSEPSLTEAILDFEKNEQIFCPRDIREHSLQFDSNVFKRKIAEFISGALKDFNLRNQA